MLKNDWDSRVGPPGKKFWVWENRWDSYECIYLVACRDGPGEDGKDLGWFDLRHLSKFKQDINLIDL